MRHAPVLVGLGSQVWPRRRRRSATGSQIAAMMRIDRVSFKGRQQARLPVAGLAVAYRVLRALRIEGEVRPLQANRGEVTKEISFRTAGPDASREEFQQTLVIARRTLSTGPDSVSLWSSLSRRVNPAV